MIDRSTALITGIDIPIPECHLILHQPTIEEISYMVYDNFFIGAHTLNVDKKLFSNEGESDLTEVSNFQIFMTIINENSMEDKKSATKNVLSLMFPKYKINFTPRALLFIDSTSNETMQVDESNFEAFQDIIREVLCLKRKDKDEIVYNVRQTDKRAKEIRDKILKGREKVAKLKNEEGNNIFVTYISVLSTALHIPITNFKTYTIFMLYDQVERLGLYSSWDIDIRSRLAGGEPEGPPPEWMKNIH